MGDQVRLWCKRGGICGKWSHAYDHRSLGVVEMCNRLVLEILRKLKMEEQTDGWWNLLSQVEQVINGRYHNALRMTPFEAFYGTRQVH